MLKKIKLDIKSIIVDLDSCGLADGEPEINRSTLAGIMRIAADETVLSYKDKDENGSVSCSITVRENTVTVRREGAIASVMVFNTDEPFRTVYSVPPYKFDMEIKTKRLIADLSDSGGKIDILYVIDVGGTKREAKMSITASEVAGV